MENGINNNTRTITSGVKKSLVLVPGTSWISGRTSIYFHPMSGGQVKNSMLVYFSLTRTSYLVTGQVKILMDLPGGQVKFFRFFYPWTFMWDILYLHFCITKEKTIQSVNKSHNHVIVTVRVLLFFSFFISLPKTHSNYRNSQARWRLENAEMSIVVTSNDGKKNSSRLGKITLVDFNNITCLVRVRNASYHCAVWKFCNKAGFVKTIPIKRCLYPATFNVIELGVPLFRLP